MKRTKRSLAETIPLRLKPGQAGMLNELSTALGDKDDFRAAEKIFSIGLFVLGLDPRGDYSLDEITDALYGKGSGDAVTVYNSIVDAGGTAGDTRANAERAQRSSVQAEAVAS